MAITQKAIENAAQPASRKATAKLFMNGRSQAVRLPAFCRFEGQEINIEKIGEQVILTPRRPAWADFFANPERPTEDFMQEREDFTITERDQFE